MVRNHWWNGFGIRMRPGLRLHKVSGLDAVELRLSNEVRQKLEKHRPANLAQAARIDGMTPAALFVLLAALKKPGQRKSA